MFFHVSAHFAHQLTELWFGQGIGDIARHSLNKTFAHTAAICLLLALLYQYRRIQQHVWQHWLLAGILILDLLIAGKRVNFYAPEDFFTAVPPIIQTVHLERGEGRLFRAENPERVTITHAPSDHIMWGDRWNLEVLGLYTAALYRIPVIFHEDVERLAQVYVRDLQSLLDTLPWEKKLPFLSAGNVTLIVTSGIVESPGIELITGIPNRSHTRFYLYKNTAAANRIEFVPQGQFVESDKDALALMLHPDYDPRKHVVLQEPTSRGVLPFFNKTQREQPEKTVMIAPKHGENIGGNVRQCETVQVKEISKSIHASHLSVVNSCDGYLVFSEPYYPGWKVSIDGTSTSILRANYAFSAIFLEAGEHEVQRRYRPNSLLVGIISSLVFGSLFVCVVYKKWSIGGME
jgi:hypothetical protein